MLSKYMVGVIENGGNPSLDVPVDPRTPISLVRGSTLRLVLAVVMRSGEPATLTGGTISMVVKGHSEDADAKLTLSGTIAPTEGPGVATISITAANTEGLDPGRYVYDIWFEDSGGDRAPIVPLSTFHVEPNSVPVS